MGRAKRNPSSGGGGCDGFRLSPLPILRGLRGLGQAHTQPLKHLFQEAGVSPWQRDWQPLIYLDDTLAAVARLRVCHPFAARAGELGWRILWAVTAKNWQG
jgi:tRNA(Ile)-lysidine synthetase-like protein